MWGPWGSKEHEINVSQPNGQIIAPGDEGIVHALAHHKTELATNHCSGPDA